MLSEEQYFHANEWGTGYGSWQAQFAQTLYKTTRDNLKGTFPWDIAAYLGLCENRTENTKLFGSFFENEKEAVESIKDINVKTDISTNFIIESDINVTFDGIVARKIRSVKDHKNGYALYFKYVDNDNKAYYQKLTVNHDRYIPYDDEVEFENITSYVINNIPINGEPAYKYCLDNFSTEGFILDKDTTNPDMKLDYKAAQKENEERKKVLSVIKNIKNIVNLKDDMPKYYTECNQCSNTKQHWVDNHGTYFGRITYRVYKELVAKKYQVSLGYFNRKDYNITDDSVVNICIRGVYKYWEDWFLGTNHCFYNEKTINASIVPMCFADWTVEHQLGMDLVDAMVIERRNDNYTEVDTVIHDDVDWVINKINQNFYGKKRLCNDVVYDNN